MQTVGAFEAKTHLSRLLRDVEQNKEKIIIHRHHHNIACLVPFGDDGSGTTKLNIMEEFKNIRETKAGNSGSVKTLVTEGRKR